MLSKYLNKTQTELDVLATQWVDIDRIKSWNTKNREKKEDIEDFYISMPDGYLADLDRIAKKNTGRYLKNITAAGLKVLDFGCGTGEYGLSLASQGAEVDFFDLDTPASKFLKWRLEDRKLEKCRFVPKIEGLKTQYDIIICIDVLEHLINPDEIFKLLSGKLPRFGKIIISSPLIYPLFGLPLPQNEMIDGEHIKIAVDDWFKNKTDEYIKKNYIRHDYVFTKTDLRFLLLYNYNPGTTGDFFEKALGLYGRVMASRQTQIKQNGEGIKSIIKELDVNCLIQVDSGNWIKIPKGIEIPKIVYSIDTFFATNKVKKDILYPYDFKFYAQKRFAKEKNEFWLPLAVDIDTYKFKHTVPKYDIAFCGTFLVRGIQAERNKCLKALVNKHWDKMLSVYIGRDYNEYACLRYNEAKIVFNMGIQNDINMRFFEAMATGTPQLYNNVDGIEELGFKPDIHYIEFNNAEDVTKKLFLALNNHEKLKAISSAAYSLVIAKHQYKHRVEQMIKETKL